MLTESAVAAVLISGNMEEQGAFNHAIDSAKKLGILDLVIDDILKKDGNRVQAHLANLQGVLSSSQIEILLRYKRRDVVVNILRNNPDINSSLVEKYYTTWISMFGKAAIHPSLIKLTDLPDSLLEGFSHNATYNLQLLKKKQLPLKVLEQILKTQITPLHMLELLKQKELNTKCLQLIVDKAIRLGHSQKELFIPLLQHPSIDDKGRIKLMWATTRMREVRSERIPTGKKAGLFWPSYCAANNIKLPPEILTYYLQQLTSYQPTKSILDGIEKIKAHPTNISGFGSLNEYMSKGSPLANLNFLKLQGASDPKMLQKINSLLVQQLNKDYNFVDYCLRQNSRDIDKFVVGQFGPLTLAQAQLVAARLGIRRPKSLPAASSSGVS